MTGSESVKGNESVRGTVFTRAALAIAALLMLGALVSGCAEEAAPDATVQALGKAVGEAKLDETDFADLLSRFTAPGYGGEDPAQAHYELFLAAKAAGLAFGSEQDEGPKVTTEITDDEALVSFAFGQRSGLFAVADIGTVDVRLEYTDDADLPWRIVAVELRR